MVFVTEDSGEPILWCFPTKKGKYPSTNVRKYENISVKEYSVPKTQVVFFCEKDGLAPVLEWLDDLPSKVQLKCVDRIERLKQEGYSLRRPEADFLRDKIYELRIGFQGVNYRMLYFFHGTIAAVISHGIIKEAKVPSKEIDRAIERMKKFIQDPEAHTYEE